MKALVLSAPGETRVEDVPPPRLSPGWALVKVAYAGVCGSDIPRIYDGKAYYYPLICGHEFSGTVAEAADGTSGRFPPGTRVTAFPLIWDGVCPACETGDYARCEHYDYIGSRRDGAFAEYVAIPERNLLALPEGVSLKAAALTEPAAVACRAIGRGGDYLGKTVVVFGAGPIGLLAAGWARIAGAARIVVADPVSEKRDFALRLGVDLAFDPREKTVEDTLSGAADICVEASGNEKALNAAILATVPGGIVLSVGNQERSATLSAEALAAVNRRELTIRGCWNSSFRTGGTMDDWRRTLWAIDNGALDVETLVTRVAPLAESAAAIEQIRRGAPNLLKTLIQCDLNLK